VISLQEEEDRLMSGMKKTKASRLGWLAIHGGFLVWGICLIVLAEEHRDGAEHSAAIAEKSADSAANDASKTQSWVDSRIEDLGDPVYGVRAKATRQLMAAGPHAAEGLSLALKSRDPEVARRSQYILERIARSDHAGFVALEKIACTPGHPAAKVAEAIVQNELDRRERVIFALAEQRQMEAHQYLREARAALYQGRFEEAREKALAAQALDASYKLFDDRPELVLAAIQQSEARRSLQKAAEFATADRE
jgi:hypothetical protein